MCSPLTDGNVRQRLLDTEGSQTLVKELFLMRLIEGRQRIKRVCHLMVSDELQQKDADALQAY